MNQPDFKNRINALSDTDALRVMAFVADDLRTELRLGQQIGLSVGTDLNDDEAVQRVEYADAGPFGNAAIAW